MESYRKSLRTRPMKRISMGFKYLYKPKRPFSGPQIIKKDTKINNLFIVLSFLIFCFRFLSRSVSFIGIHFLIHFVLSVGLLVVIKASLPVNISDWFRFSHDLSYFSSNAGDIGNYFLHSFLSFRPSAYFVS